MYWQTVLFKLYNISEIALIALITATVTVYFLAEELSELGNDFAKHAKKVKNRREKELLVFLAIFVVYIFAP